MLGELKQANQKLVFTGDGDVPITRQVGRTWMGRALDRAELRQHGPHSLRHTFCSHLAMRGIAARVIQQLAGHSELTTTQRYMHLSPGASEAARNPTTTAGRSRVETCWRRLHARPPHTPQLQ
ncbi:tyrosine-type recombinase/integrase [Enhygromyxa salina]|uniref:Tyrosine recombinase XerD n=1 Tax=Enhygromyxa salina TaxID=215803 RepID=A0A2S9YUS0_9BACT|nr:tyrosine-type recombinase/integrase [Enhygromyxa salina]PRQ08789.1 Tyrosine recombinase XerD [Enhygromyxa salina]